MSDATDDFDRFLATRLEASTAFVNGDVEPLLRISAASPASIFGPSGTIVSGAEQVNAVNADGASHFGPGATNAFDIAHRHADGDLAYWTGVQRSVLHPRGADAPVAMDLRVTEIFRREQGEWRLLHRHADELRGEVQNLGPTR